MAVIISNKALKLKLNPTTSQYSQFLKSFGCERFVYNFYLAEKNNFYEKEDVKRHFQRVVSFRTG